MYLVMRIWNTTCLLKILKSSLLEKCVYNTQVVAATSLILVIGSKFLKGLNVRNVIWQESIYPQPKCRLKGIKHSCTKE